MTDSHSAETFRQINKNIPAIFTALASKHPDKTALICGSQALTYSELNLLSSHLAHRLQTAGVDHETPVAILAKRSLETIVSILAILKAGGAYVPLDPEYPVSRLHFMLNDIRPPLIILQKNLRNLVPEFNGTIISPDLNQANNDTDSLPESPYNFPASTIAYIMYTSGSTGQPKGVEILHRGIINLVVNPNYASLDENQVFLLHSPFSFDASTFEIWAPLLNGGTLVIAPPERLSPKDLSFLIPGSKITTILLTPSLFHYLVDEYPGCLEQVKQLLVGGDILSPRAVRKVLEAHPDITLINAYGPTENTVITCCYSMTRETCVGNTVPIGKPVSNTEIYILDEKLKPVPKGQPGELCTTGPGLARGYFNREEETSKCFIPNPFNNDPTSRIYKTGDLVRQLPDDNIEFIGRKDHQVKIRGFRIEPGEIETATAQFPEIKQNLVAVRDDLPGGKCLVFYYIPSGNEVDNEYLRRRCHEILPEHMVPQYFVRLKSFPLTPVGKIDRKALPRPSETDISTSDHHPPVTKTEKKLAEIWQEILGLDKISIDHNFFHLGGHSLLAAKLLTKIKKDLGLEISFRQFYLAPTIKQLATRINQLAEEPKPNQYPPLTSTKHPRNLPLTPAQHLLWVQQQMFPDSSAYNIVTVLKINGEIDQNILKRGIITVINRHKALRCFFPTAPDGKPIQNISDTAELDWQFIKCDDQTIDKITELLDTEACRPFDLSTPPLVRARLYTNTHNRSLLLLVVHHIILDGWSQNIFLEELAETYRAIIENRTPDLSELPAQYPDYVIWQQSLLKTKELQKQLSYWLRQLQNPPTLQLPTDFPRPNRFSFKGAHQQKQIPQDLIDQLSQLAQQRECTLFMLLLSAWYILLSRYSGQNDIIIGTALSGRTIPGSEKLIGYFANVLPLRITAQRSTPFIKLLDQVKDTVLSAFENQDVPTKLIIEKTASTPSPDRTPLIQSFFIFHKEQERAKQLGNADITQQPCDNKGSTADLSCWVKYTSNGYCLDTEYCTDLFRPETIIRLQENFITLLKNLPDNYNQPLAQLPLLSMAEISLIRQWNQTKATFPTDQLVHELIAERAASIPDKTALVDALTSLTFAQMNQQANRIARLLQDQGVSSNTFVGLCVGRSLKMIYIILGILKAGGTYLPLDPDFPRERLAYILEETKAPLVITEKELLDRLPEQSQSKFILTENLDKLLNSYPASSPNRPAGLTPESPAYIIFTSGSTGRPKGVQVPHRALVNFLHSIPRMPGFDANNRMLAITTLSFDLSIPDIFFPPFIGACTCIAGKNDVLDGNRFQQLLKTWDITILSTTPSTLRILQMHDWPGKPNLSIVTIGEPLTEDLRDFLLPRVKELWNLYGPTETTVWSTGCRVQPNEPIHIGKPIANTTIYILDEKQQPTPIGVSGELYIGGAGVTLGYLKQPELNQKHFIPNPFDHNGIDPILYKTGDLARYRYDGNIEFLGRRDNQVKVRGFRIELGEIENALNNCKAVKQGIVIVSSDNSGDNQLTAFVVPHNNQPLSPTELQRELGEVLPDYMIPSRFIKLESFPLTPNGKIDRKALPQFSETNISTCDYHPPVTETEKKLAEIWQRILGLGKISIDHNFFHLGGHSLLAVQLISKLQKETGIDLPLAILFKLPTIRELAAHIASIKPKATISTRQETSWSCLVPIQPHGSKPPLFLFHAIGGNVLNYYIFRDYLGPDQPIYGLQARGLDGISKPFHDMKSMAKHYTDLIQATQPLGPYFLAGGSFGGSVALEVARNLKKEGQEIAFLAMFDTYGPNSSAVQLERLPLYKKLLNKLAQIDMEPNKTIFQLFKKHLPNCFNNTIYQIFRLTGLPVPHELRYWYIKKINFEIILNYQPPPYNGDIIFFRNCLKPATSSSNNKQGWDGIIQGKFLTIDIESEHSQFIENETFGNLFSTALINTYNKLRQPKRYQN